MKQLIAGYGFVGEEVSKLFPKADVYDPVKIDYTVFDHTYYYDPPTEHYDICHCCVPTPMKEDGSCDVSAVEDVIEKIDAEIFIVRSTVPPGTCHRLECEAGKRDFEKWFDGGKKGRQKDTWVVMQPEYVASSSPYPAPLSDMKTRDFVILGGRPEITKKVRKLYETVYPPTVRICEVDSKTAEIIKYAENAFIATKVTFCNEVHGICQLFKADYDQVREGVFRLDPRMTEWWTYCEGKGWGGHCLPKDMASLVSFSGSDFFADVIKHNRRHRNEGS